MNIDLICGRINNGYNANLKKVFIPYKKKFIPILLLLNTQGLIGNFLIEKSNNKIIIELRYYHSKPIVYLKAISTGGYKQYLPFRSFKLTYQKKLYNQSIYSNKYGYLEFNEMLFLKSGGKAILKIFLLSKNIIS